MIAQADSNPVRGEFFAEQDFNPGSLPTVFRKAFDLGLTTFAETRQKPRQPAASHFRPVT